VVNAIGQPPLQRIGEFQCLRFYMNRLLIFCTLTLLLSCEYNDTGLTNNPIDSKIFIETRELLDINFRSLTFHCKTEKIYPCVNFPILTDKGINDNSFQITFTGIGETTICFTALGPASTVVDLRSVKSGEYPIEFNNAKLKNRGMLKVNDNEIQLVFSQQTGIEIVRPITKRVPQNTYWGTIGYHQSSSINLVNEFLQKLTNKGAKFNKQTPGHYFYYEIDENGDIVTDMQNSGYYFVKAFIFQFDGDESELKNFIRIDGKPYKADLSINVETFKGEQVNNWTE
jgi:hypothetical protein